MKKITVILLSAVILLVINSCDSTRRLQKKTKLSAINDSTVAANKLQAQLDSIFKSFSAANGNDTPIFPSAKYPEHPVPTHFNDILHTKLDIKFDWKLRHVIGKANIRVRPYFHPVKTLVLDAKTFDFNDVALVSKNGTTTPLKYEYDGNLLTILLDRTYTRTDTYEVFIDYIAKPYERETSTGTAITSDRGLYFINHDNSKENVPQQIWTQGETTANSCWFPTFDHPSEKMTEEIAITVEDRFLTISNGKKVKSVANGDGTHTDFWAQDKPHSPYLFALAVGEFGEYKDKWRDKEVNYYLEKKYAPYAKNIFGNTPEMIEFFSQKLGVDFPWDKYSQVVVREFVSGAMENTSCTIFYDELNKDARELLDGDNEDVIAHELFHHWFGDLVTCESYANLALNESFATYSEYLWFEYKYGKDAADMHLQTDLGNYLMESSYKKASIIRYRYDKDDDLFDNHSYQKGGLVLHTLRNYLGDEVFFTALHNYLVKYSYQNTELANLRMEFEAVSGEDLNWFFNQWFLSPGHPELEYTYKQESGRLTLNVKQVQAHTPEVPIFRLYVKAQVADNMGNTQIFPICINSADSTFTFNYEGKIENLVLDSEGILLGSIENKNEWSIPAMISQYQSSKNYRPRRDAIEYLSANFSKEGEKTILQALSDPFWNIRQTALSGISLAESANKNEIIRKVIGLTQDKKADVRASALYVLGQPEAYSMKETDTEVAKKMESILPKLLQDSSYSVQNNALSVAENWQPQMLDEFTKELTGKEASNTVFTVINILGMRNDVSALEKLISLTDNMPDLNDRFYAIHNLYQEYYGIGKPEVQQKILNKWMEVAENDSEKPMRMAALDALLTNIKMPEVKAFFQKEHPQEKDEEIKKVYTEMLKRLK